MRTVERWESNRFSSVARCPPSTTRSRRVVRALGLEGIRKALRKVKRPLRNHRSEGRGTCKRKGVVVVGPC